MYVSNPRPLVNKSSRNKNIKKGRKLCCTLLAWSEKSINESRINCDCHVFDLLQDLFAFDSETRVFRLKYPIDVTVPNIVNITVKATDSGDFPLVYRKTG